MKPSELKSFLATTILAIPEPLFIWGPPGIGKSAIVRQVAQENGLDLIDLRATLLDPVDLRGLPLPVPAEKQAVWLPPAFLPQSGRGILFLDELNSAPPLVQAAAYQLVLDRRVGEYILPEEWVIVAAGNRENDAGVTFRMPAPLANRFVHIQLDVDIDDWVAWALTAGVEDEVIAFIRFRPQLLFAFDPQKYTEKAFPTPRTWEKVSRFLSHFKAAGVQPSSPVAFEVFRGCVGEGPAAEFCAYLKVWSRIPPFEEILLNPDTAPVPEGRDVQYALSTMISRRITKDNIPAAIRYIQRLEEEFQVLIFKQALQTPQGRALTSTRPFIEWASKHASLII